MVAVPMVTPFDASDQIDFDAAQRNVERWCQTANRVFIVGSQSGEEFMMSEPERVELLHCVTGALEGDRVTAGGIDAPSVVETLRQRRAAAVEDARLVEERVAERVDERVGLPTLLLRQFAADVQVPHARCHHRARCPAGERVEDDAHRPVGRGRRAPPQCQQVGEHRHHQHPHKRRH